jgi:hypothetical protein
MAQARIVVWCRDCRHRAEPDPAELARRHGADTPIPEWHRRLVCSQCGSRAVDFVLTGAAVAVRTSPPGRGGPRPRGFPSTASGTMGLLNWPRGCRPRRAPKNKCSLVFVSLYQASSPSGVGLRLGALFRRPAQSVICAHQKDGSLMLDRRRILAAALCCRGLPSGCCIRPAGAFSSPNAAASRSGRVAPADPAPGIGHEVAGGGMAAAGFGCSGAGGAEWARAFRLGGPMRPEARAASRYDREYPSSLPPDRFLAGPARTPGLGHARGSALRPLKLGAYARM